MIDVVIANIPKMQKSTFGNTNPKLLTFTGFIQEFMISRVPSDNVIIRKYKNILASSERPIPDVLKDILDVGNIPKRTGVK